MRPGPHVYPPRSVLRRAHHARANDRPSPQLPARLRSRALSDALWGASRHRPAHLIEWRRGTARQGPQQISELARSRSHHRGLFPSSCRANPRPGRAKGVHRETKSESHSSPLEQVAGQVHRFGEGTESTLDQNPRRRDIVRYPAFVEADHHRARGPNVHPHSTQRRDKACRHDEREQARSQFAVRPERRSR